MDYRQYYDLETYLLETVRPRFHAEGSLSAFDFFCIIVWKANRAKSRVARLLLRHGRSTLEAAVRELTRTLAHQRTARERLEYLVVTCRLRLPIASAVLTVLYPEEFTVYDTRVCDTLGGFHNLANLHRFERVWDGYEAFRRAVEAATPPELSLRDKERWLVGKEFSVQLALDIARKFAPGQPQEFA